MKRFTVIIRPLYLPGIAPLPVGRREVRRITMIAPDWETAFDAASDEWSGWEVDVREWQREGSGRDFRF